MGVDVFLEIASLRHQIEDFLPGLRGQGEVEIEAVGLIGIGGHAAARLVAGRAIGLNANRVMLRQGGGEIEGEGERCRGLSFGLRLGKQRRKDEQAENLKWTRHESLFADAASGHRVALWRSCVAAVWR